MLGVGCILKVLKYGLKGAVQLKEYQRVELFIRNKNYKPKTDIHNIIVKILISWESWNDECEMVDLDEYLNDIVGEHISDFDYRV